MHRRYIFSPPPDSCMHSEKGFTTWCLKFTVQSHMSTMCAALRLFTILSQSKTCISHLLYLPGSCKSHMMAFSRLTKAFVSFSMLFFSVQMVSFWPCQECQGLKKANKWHLSVEHHRKEDAIFLLLILWINISAHLASFGKKRRHKS